MRYSLILAILCAPLALSAQTFWMNFGVGAGDLFDDSELVENEKAGSAFTVSANVATFENQLMTLRAAVVNSDVYYVNPTGNQGDRGEDIALLYGWMYKSDIFMGSLSAGLAYTTIETRDPQESDHLIGYPLESQVFWTPTDYLGIGLIGVANINPTTSFAAGFLGFQFGKLR